jgi:Mce-associated membrane protein
VVAVADAGERPADSAKAKADAIALAEQAEAEAAEAEALAAAARARARAIKLRREAQAEAEAEADKDAEDTTTVVEAADDTAEAPETPEPSEESERSERSEASEPPEPPAGSTESTRQRLRVPGLSGLSRLSALSRVLAAAAILAICGLLGASGWMLWHHHTVLAERQRSAAYVAAARQGVVNLTSLDFNKAKEDVQRVLDSATGEFRDDFQRRADDFASVVKDSKAVTQGSVTASAVESMSKDSAVVLVLANERVTNSAGAKDDPRAFRFRVSVVRDGDQLKISKVEFVL